MYPMTIGDKEGPKRWKVVPCGKCKACRRRKQASWSFRLLQEMQRSTSAAFLTMTYADHELAYGERYPTLVKRELQLFKKRLRKAQSKLTNDKIKYYSVGEYSPEGRPHYHSIMFNLHPTLMLDGPLSKIWTHGHVRVDDCNIRTIQYCTKYVMKSSVQPLNGKEREFAMMSKRLGDNFLTPQMIKYYKENQIPYIVWKDGQKMTMPRYYKERIFTEEELRKFGKEALREVKPKLLDTTKVHEINEEIRKLKKKIDDRRKTIDTFPNPVHDRLRRNINRH